MGIDAIAPIGFTPSIETTSPVASPKADFGPALTQGIQSVDDALRAADQQVRLLASGQEVAPHDVMISMEEARMHLMLLSEVRNRIVEGYQELSRMQL